MSDENKNPEQILSGSDPLLNGTDEQNEAIAAAADNAAETAEAAAETAEAAAETAEAAAETAEAAAETAEAAAETAEEKVEAEAAGITSAAAEESAALNDELEQLRSTFQSELDKATADAKAAEDMQPVIQELDEGPDPDDDEDDDNGENDKAEDEDGKKAKKKKKKSGAKKPVGLIVALVLICILIVAPLSAYFVLSIKEPNLNSFISAYAAAESAKDAETKVTKYTEALGFCTEDSKVLAGEKQKLTEKVVIATCEAQGYSAAYSYMTSNLDEDAQAKPRTKDFKQFLKIPEQLETVYAAAPEKLPEAIEKAGGADKLDCEALAKELKTPALVQKETAENLQTLAKAIEGAGNTEDDDSFYDAMHDYLSCYQKISSMGVKAQTIPEDILVRLWNNGYAYEASLTLNQFFTEEMRAAVTNEDVTGAISELEALKNAGIDADAIAAKQMELNKTSDADLTAAISADVSDTAKKAVVKLIKGIVDARKAEEDHNLTVAKRQYTVAVASEDSLNMPVTETALRMASVLLRTGDIDNAYTYVTNYLLDSGDNADAANETAPADAETTDPAADNAATEENADTAAASADALLAAHPEFTSDYNEIVALHKAQETVEEVFSEAYYAAAYGGGSFDTAGVCASLDEIPLTNPAPYVSAYVNYYKYVAEIYGDMNKDNMLNHITLAELGFGSHSIICASDKAQIYLSKGDTVNAFAIAKSILAVDAGHDLANSLLSKEQRIAGDAAAAKAFALTGIDAMGNANADYCSAEMGILMLIEGNYADAYERISSLYETQRTNGNLTVDTAELLLAAGSLYKSADEDEQTKIDETVKEVNDLFTQNSLTVSENTQALIDGKKQPADVYLGEAVTASLTKTEE